MTSLEVSERYGVAGVTVRKWAADNSVAFIGNGRRKTYVWTEKDCKRFVSRRGKGWEKGRPRKEIIQ